MLSSNLKLLRIFGLLEGLSFLVLMGVGMPLKYFYEMPETNQVVGMAHGILFIVYCMWVVICGQEQKWGKQNTAWALVASILPCGTFVADHKIFKKYAV